ncbi:MAG: putative Ig domain-containing protein [Actinomycetes bacterium]
MNRRPTGRGSEERRVGTTATWRSLLFSLCAVVIVLAGLTTSGGLAMAVGDGGQVPPPLLLTPDLVASPAVSPTPNPGASPADSAPGSPSTPLPSASGSGSASTQPLPSNSPIASASGSAVPTSSPSDSATPIPSDCAPASQSPSPAVSDPTGVWPTVAACATPTPSPTEVVYEVSPAVQKIVAVKGQSMTSSSVLTTNFAASADSTVTFAIAPDVPAGLTMDPSTGVISGTPELAQPATAYVVTADDGTHQAIATLGITVLDGPIIEPAQQTVRAVIGEPVEPTTAFTWIGFRSSPMYFTRPELPGGLTIDFRTGIISGQLSDAPTETLFTVFAFDGATAATSELTIIVACPSVISGENVLPDLCLRPIGDIGTGRHGVDPNLRTVNRSLRLKGDADIHGPYGPTTGSCASCHRIHAETRPTFMGNQTSNPRQISTLCFTCHDASGTGSKYTVQAEYVSGGVNVVNATTRQYYTHDSVSAVNTRHTTATMAPSGTSAPVDEFAGVLNRHSECTDCHNPHSDSATPSVQSPLGTPWTPSGRMTGVSAVKVTYNPTTQAPIYQFLDGVTNKATAEYQLCMKCHSSYTTLPSNAGFPESQYLLDAAVEFNPAAKSMHPVEAPGKNQTPAMGLSLSGASTYKLWDGTTAQTIRCTQCHASSPMVLGQGGGQTAAPHAVAKNTVPNYGVLTAPYNRSDGTVTFSEAQYALCFTCHTNSPFISGTGTTVNGANSPATNFNRHYDHVTSWRFTCQECHYRPHSTALPATGGGTQTLDGGGGVNFAPTVTPNGGTLRYTRTVPANGGNITGTCTLTCHGMNHSENYS